MIESLFYKSDVLVRRGSIMLLFWVPARWTTITGVLNSEMWFYWVEFQGFHETTAQRG